MYTIFIPILQLVSHKKTSKSISYGTRSGATAPPATEPGVGPPLHQPQNQEWGHRASPASPTLVFTLLILFSCLPIILTYHFLQYQANNSTLLYREDQIFALNVNGDRLLKMFHIY